MSARFSAQPRHVAIIMDGNGRWAEQRGKARPEGHAAGSVAVRDTLRAASEAGIPWLTLYAFSVANWARPADEVEALMGLLADFAVREAAELCARKVELRIVGALEDLPPRTRQAIDDLVTATRHAADGAPSMTVSIALSYSSRRDLALAARRHAEAVRDGRIDPMEITEQSLRQQLSTGSIPDVDLLIRTGGERRLSDFLLFEAAYAELYFTEVLWPDFRAEDLRGALAHFSSRERRFGRTGQQVREAVAD